LGGKLTLSIEPAAEVQVKPLRSVSQSEDGFEKIMQSVCLTIRGRGPALGIRLSVQKK
jgi:hypothetical protein